MTARWQKTSEAVKTISAEKVRIKIYLVRHGVATAIKIFFPKILSPTMLTPKYFPPPCVQTV